MTTENAVNDDEDRIRRKAHELWEAEGHPEGRADAHWTMAREMIANEDSLGSTLIPLPDAQDSAEPVEPALAIENQGDFPGLADQGEESARPPRRSHSAVEDSQPAYGEPNGPRPPVFDVVPQSASEIQRQGGGTKGSDEAASETLSARAEEQDVPIKGFHGGVEHSQEMRAARRKR